MKRAITAVTLAALVARAVPAAADPLPPPAAPPPTAPIRSPGMLRGGIALTFVGGLGATTGAVLLMVSSFGCPDRCEDSASRSRALGAPLLGVSAAVLAAGIVLIVIGNQKAPKAPQAALVGASGTGGPGWVWTF